MKFNTGYMLRNSVTGDNTIKVFPTGNKIAHPDYNLTGNRKFITEYSKAY
jgi:hypothetical protein